MTFLFSVPSWRKLDKDFINNIVLHQLLRRCFRFPVGGADLDCCRESYGNFTNLQLNDNFTNLQLKNIL
jgi:hypothetical protein